MLEVFFTAAVASRKANGEYVVVLQIVPVRGGAPIPVGVIECREAGALALREALDAVLRNRSEIK